MNYLKAPDGVKIAYQWNPSTRSGTTRGYLLLLHMMPATKESWKDFAEEMAKEDYASLAIDLRGHGESTTATSDKGQEIRLDYRNFSDEEHQKSVLDVKAAVDYLKKQGAPPEKIVLIGASIGANLALWYLAEHPEIKAAILLSAGFDYHGIKTEPLIKRLKPGQRILLFSAKDDVRAGRDNPSMNKQLAEDAPEGAEAELVVLEKGGHGTDYVDKALDKIKEFVVKS